MVDPEPRLSVVVTSYESPAVLRLCLEALVRQPEVAEIVVSDCSAQNPAPLLAAAFPNVLFLHWPERRRVPELRWAALSRTTGSILGAIEARCVPAPDWAVTILAAHRAQSDAPAAGGPVAPGPCRSAFDWGLYFCEYGAFAPPVADGPARALSGANLSYKRAALEESPDVLDSAAWETFLHARWIAQGRTLRLCPAAIAFHNTMAPVAALRQRYHYGRGYASDRAVYELGSLRYAYALFSPLLPALLTLRHARQAFAKGFGGRFVQALLWVFALNAAWAAGEAVGYMLGPDPRPRIF